MRPGCTPRISLHGLWGAVSKKRGGMLKGTFSFLLCVECRLVRADNTKTDKDETNRIELA